MANNTQQKPYMFGKELITCGYCKKTLPHKYCKRHNPQSSIRRVQLYTLEQVEAECTRREQALLDDMRLKVMDEMSMYMNPRIIGEPDFTDGLSQGKNSAFSSIMTFIAAKRQSLKERKQS